MDANQLRLLVGDVVAQFRADMAELDAVLAQYDLEILPPPPPETLVSTTLELQAALTDATIDTIRIADGVMLSGNFTLARPVRLVSNSGGIVTPNVSPALTINGDAVTVEGLIVESAPGAPTSDLMILTGTLTTLRGMIIRGNGQTKRGIAVNGVDTLIEDCQILNICRTGQETQAVAGWNYTGLTMRGCVLQGGSTGFLSGGSSPTVPNHVPADVLFENCTFTRPLEWKAFAYACKTGLEIKSGKRFRVLNCTVENVWPQGQTGYAFTFTPSQYGNSPETIIEDVLVEGCIIRNCGGGLNALGYSQHQSTLPTLVSRNIRFIGNTFELTRWGTDGISSAHGALMQLGGGGPAQMEWTGNTCTSTGDAFLRTTATVPTEMPAIEGFSFTGNTVYAGTYGVLLDGLNRGAGWATAFPSGAMTGNTFTGAHSIFRTNFPNNVWG